MLITIIFLGSFSRADAQQEAPVRIELTANLSMEDYNLVSCGEHGLLVFFESEEKGSEEDTRIWHFAFYDKNFQQQWLADTALIDGAKFKAFENAGQNTYLLFVDVDKHRSTHNIQILKVDYGSNEFSILNSLSPEKSGPVHFSIRDGKAITAFNNAVFAPRILFIDLADGTSKEVKPVTDGMNIIQKLHFAPDGRHFYTIIEHYTGKKQSSMLILKLDHHGNTIKTYSIETALENKVINEARIAYSNGDTLLVMGTYSNYATKVANNKDEAGPETAGYFVTKFIDDKEVFINYYNFLEFEEMYRALSSKTIADLRKKAEKQKNKGEEYSLDYTLLLHDVIPFMGNFVLMAEAYYPEYRTETSMYYDYYGRPMPQTYTVFDGYSYISAIVAGFSPDGQLVWDDGVEIREIQTFKLSKYIENYVSSNELAIFYSSENRLYYKMSGDPEMGDALQNIPIKSRYKGDKVVDDLGSKVIPWYNNYFICYGYQEIKNNRVSGGKRTVFYFNKLTFK